jgi:hypothetical protein
VADRAEVPAVVHGHDPDPDLARFLDGQPHRLRAHDDAEALLGVDHRGAGRLALELPAGSRVELPRPVVAHVGAQHVGHAVGLDPAQVGHGQHVRRVRGVLRRDAELLEDLGGGSTQRGFRDQHLVLQWHLETLEDHGWLPPGGPQS